jgi:hypothetical protein
VLRRANLSCTFLPRQVWYGIFAAGDGRAKRDLKTLSLHRDRKSETTNREPTSSARNGIFGCRDTADPQRPKDPKPVAQIPA